MAIAEFPTIRVDDFRIIPDEPNPELCFLTHMHEDHTNGLARRTYYGPVVYCSAATRALLLNFRPHCGSGDLKYNHLRKEVCGKEIVRVLDIGKPYTFELRNGSSVQATLIDANHCPGATMVLLQPQKGNGSAVLYTGDFKCEKWHLDSLRHVPVLFPFLKELGGNKRLSLYVDDTFNLHADPFKTYPENHIGVNNLVKLLESYPPEVHFCLTDSVTGHEEVLITLAQRLDTLIHMSPYFYNFYRAAVDTSPVARKLLEYCTLDLEDDRAPTMYADHDSPRSKKSVRLHFCQKNMACPMRDPHGPMAYFKPCNQPMKKVVDLHNAQHSAAMIPPGIMIPFEDNAAVFKGPDQRYFLDTNAKKFYPLFPWFYFSRHASYPEVRQFCDMFNVRSVMSLSGQPVACLHPGSADTAVNDTTRVGKKSSYSRTRSLGGLPKRVASLTEGFVGNNEELPILAKKRKIRPFYDRMVIQQQRERARRKRISSESDSETDSEDEDDRHTAMMLLRQGNAVHQEEVLVEREQSSSRNASRRKEAVSMASKSSSHTRSISRKVCSDEATTSTICRIHEDVSKSTEMCAPLGDFETDVDSPDSTPPLYASFSASFRVAHSNCDQINDESGLEVIDETLEEDLAVRKLHSLVARLRKDPEYWFDIKVECISQR